MKRHLLLLIFLLVCLLLNAQRFIGGRLNRDRTHPTGLLGVAIHTYTLDAPVPVIKINWGDGVVEEVQSNGSDKIGEGIYRNYYNFFHVYESPGEYTVSYVDSFWVEDILNLENSGEQYFRLEEKVVFSDTSLVNIPPFIRSPFPVNYSIREDGTIDFPVNYIEIELDEVALRFRPFPGEGYSLPPATDTLICCIEWRTPPAPGRYVFAMEAADFRNGEELSTNTLLIALDVPAVSNTKKEENYNFHIFPNPAAHTLHLQFSNFPLGAATLTVQNAAGQLLYREQVELSARLQQHSVDVSGWPPGVYFLTVQAGGGQVVRRFVKTR